jgi:hypothetical protein
MSVEDIITIVVLVIAVPIAVYWFKAYSSKAPPVGTIEPSESETIEIALTPEIALQTIIRFAQSSGYKVEGVDESAGLLTLSTSANMASVGMWYPISIKENGTSGSTIEVGIKSRAFSGWIFRKESRLLSECCNGIQAASIVG